MFFQHIKRYWRSHQIRAEFPRSLYRSSWRCECVNRCIYPPALKDITEAVTNTFKNNSSCSCLQYKWCGHYPTIQHAGHFNSFCYNLSLIVSEVSNEYYGLDMLQTLNQRTNRCDNFELNLAKMKAKKKSLPEWPFQRTV